MKHLFKKLSVKLFILSLLLTVTASAQSFSLEYEHTVLADTLGADLVFEFEIINTSGEPLTVSAVRYVNDLPDMWMSSFCFENCFAPFLDSIATTPDFASEPIAAGGSMPMSIHVTSMENHGTAHLQVSVKDENDFSSNYLLELYATTEFSQGMDGFSVEAHNLSITDTLGAEMVFDMDITNESTVPLELEIARTQNDLPDGWSSSFCFDVCYPPFLDTVVTNEDFATTPLQPSETREFSVHVFAFENPGTANLEVVIKNLLIPDEIETFNLSATVETNSVENTGISPDNYFLGQNYPNPFNPSTKIRFGVKETGFVKLTVFGVLGNKVAELVNGELQTGEYEVDFDAGELSSGIYLYRLETNNYTHTQKMILEK